MQWNDGVQEVISADHDTVELLRYFVIKRVEDRGRLALNVGADYPELFIIKRKPMELSSLLIVGDNVVKKYDLRHGVERHEGIFEEGGKIEIFKYDSTDTRYPHEYSQSQESLSEMIGVIKKSLNKKNISAKNLLRDDQAQRIEHYKHVAGDIGLRGYKKQEDVYGFIDLLMRELAEKEK
jgi:hypothetical protein